jgi:hypothetical protein
MSETFSMKDPRTQTPADHEFASALESYYRTSAGSDVDKMLSTAAEF